MSAIKHKSTVHIEENSFVDDGDGIISFPLGQVISDDTVQRSGTRYDITSMEISEFNGTVTGDHVDMIQAVIAKTLGLAKRGNQLIINGLQFAIRQSPFAQLAYDLMSGGYVKDLSIETYGAPPDETGLLSNSKLVGLSVVVTGNNKSATINSVVQNSLAKSRKNGLDTTEAEKALGVETAEKPKPKEADQLVTNNKKEEDMKFVTIKNGRDFAMKLTYKNAAGDDTETELAPGATLDVAEEQAEAVEKQINAAQKPEEKKIEKKPEVDLNAFTEALNKSWEDRFDKLENKLFDKSAKEPEFKKDANGKTVGSRTSFETEANAMDWRDRHGEQIKLAWNGLKGGDPEAMVKLRQFNQFHLDALKAKGVVKNSVGLGDFGNFVISPELLTEIQGVRTDYTPLVSATQWQETLSTQMAWLERSGDINMQPVKFGPTNADADANLKPLSSYTASIKTSDLEELAAVTPVCNAATRFLAADLLGDVAIGYRNDYDRKRAQLVIARLEQSIEANGNSIPYNVPNNVDGLLAFLNVWTKIGNTTPNGTYIMGTTSFSELMKRALSAGTNGPLANIFTQRNDGVPMVFNRPYVVVSDDLLPPLNTNETRSFVVNGVTVTVNHSVFYFNPTNFTGRISGGLQYDFSTEAAYEEGGVVKSAYQRNELVLRGSFFRGGAIKDHAQVAALGSVGIS